MSAEDEIGQLKDRPRDLEAQIDRERRVTIELLATFDAVRAARDLLIERLERKLGAE